MKLVNSEEHQISLDYSNESEINWKLYNIKLEKNGEAYFNQSCEKWRSFTKREGGKIILHLENKGRLTRLVTPCEKIASDWDSVGNWRTGKKT